MKLILHLVLTTIVTNVFAGWEQCKSYGIDFVDGGGPYFINTASSDYFSFTTQFKGCNATEGYITPILIDPNGNEYFCSDIATTPDEVDQVSTCNVPGNILTKGQVFSGIWIAVIEGYTFAWMRTFSVIAGIQQTVTATPTAVFNITTTPSTTVTTTATEQDNTTLPAVTVTIPSATILRNKITTPDTVTFYSTKTLTRTRTSRLFTARVVTTTKTASCHRTTVKDPSCTIKPTKAKVTPNPSAAKMRARRADTPLPRREKRKDVLAKRSADQPTTTVTETSTTVSIYSTYTAPTSTETDTDFTTTTTTM